MAPSLPPALVELLSNTPALPPPPGITPNFVNPPSKAGTLMALNCVFLPIMLIAVTMRMTVKGIFVRNLGWDDYTCAIAAACSIIHSACIFSSLNYGFGKHLYDIPAIVLIDPNNARQLTSSTIAYAVVILTVKLSILLLYRRVFSIDRFINIGTIIGIVGVMILHIPYIGTQIYTVISCATPSSLITNNFCSHLYAINVSQSGANLITDFYILILPLPRIWGLKLEMHRKLGLCAVFAAGLVACVVSVVRLVLMWTTLSLEDYTWGTSVTIELSVVEVNVAITCACMTTLPSFLARSKIIVSSLQNKYISSSSTTSTSYPGYANVSRKESVSYWSSRKAGKGSALGSRDEEAVGLDLMKPLPKVYSVGNGRNDGGRGSGEALTQWYSSSSGNG